MATIDVKDAAGATVALEKPNGNGRQAAAGSRPVALSTEDLAAINAITAKLSADPATQTTLAAILSALGGTLTVAGTVNANLPSGLATEAKQDAANTLTGAVTETAPGTDTASSGLNGRLQRIAQRISALVALIPTGLTGNGGLKAGLVEALPAGSNVIGKVNIDADLTAGEYETVAASSTDQVLGATGGAGDYLSGVLIVPATTSPGAVSIKDGAGGAITIFTGGASSVSNLVPFFVPLGIRAGTNWKITTGANVSAIGIGNFT